MLLALFAACSDYELTEKTEAPEPGFDSMPLPEVEVDPGAVDLGVLCAASSATVNVHNAGDADLQVLGLATTGDWAVVADPSPLALAPGATLAVEVAGMGPGTLTVATDDLDEGEVEVPLQAATSTPPEVTWASPDEGAILPVSGATRLEATVADDLDPAETLVVSWSSDVDGPLGSATADASGYASIPWNAADHTPGNHTLTVEVTDSCGLMADQQRSVCQDLGYDVETLDLSTWHFEGSATWDAVNGYVELTRPVTNQAGTAFQTVSTVNADDVTIDFLFFASGGTGADGLSLTALDADRMTGFVGSTGGGIGYQGLPGWSIEVDTWYNGEYGDPTEEDHISFHLDGDYTVLAWATLPEMEDGAWHSMSVVVSGTHVTATIDGVTYLDFDAPRSLAFPAYVGFTAATGSVTNFHLIDALVVTESVCEGG